MEELSGKVAVVTGAASGIGLSLARRFADEGMKLVLADIEGATLEAAAATLPEGTETATTVCDVSKPEQVDGLRDLALDRFGAVHLVCNNAGVGSGGAIDSIPLADWEWVLGVNLWGVIHGVRTFLPLLQQQGEGHIVNTASAAGLFAAPYMGPYNVSKYGVVALSETLFHELSISQSLVGVSVRQHRPAGVEQPAGEDAVVEVINNFLSTGIEPEQVAAAVADAVKVRRFWILTHDDSVAAVKARTRAVVEDGDPPLLMH
jgi:NAD(P)-dependent dehydrogenase (short-subunit alcohol dehydrogenase family)